MRRVHVDELRVGSQQALERVEVVRPAVGVRAAPVGHLGARRAGDRERRLVAGRLDDDVVAGPEERVVDDEDALLRSGERDDVPRPRRVYIAAMAERSSGEPGTSV